MYMEGCHWVAAPEGELAFPGPRRGKADGTVLPCGTGGGRSAERSQEASEFMVGSSQHITVCGHLTPSKKMMAVAAGAASEGFRTVK